MSSVALEVVPAESRLLVEHPPELVLAEAQQAAKALVAILAGKKKPVMMNGEQYLEFEDWQTVARFYGVTAQEDGDPEFVTLGSAQGFKASSLAIDRNGRILSRATAYCLNDEEKWRGKTKYVWLYVTTDGEMVEQDPGKGRIVWVDNPNKPGGKMPKKERRAMGEEPVPLFQLASMAQTRACCKVLRNVLAWVVVLAGYRPTPAEEIQGAIDAEIKRVPGREPGSDDVVETGEGPVRVGSGERAAKAGAKPNPAAKVLPPCPACGSVKAVELTGPGEYRCSPAAGGCRQEWRA